MDTLDFDNVNTEKANAVMTYRPLPNIGKLFRFVELCLVLVFLSWSSTLLSFAIRNSGDYFRQLLAVVVSPAFIFVLGNAIVATLFAQSGLFSGQAHPVNIAETDLYQEIVWSGENLGGLRLDVSSPEPEPEEIVYQDKRIIFEASTVTPNEHDGAGSTMMDGTIPKRKTYRRTQSDMLTREASDKTKGKLWRSVTEKCLNGVNSGKTPIETPCVVDKLSNDEFQRVIEAFIAKQVRFHQEEKMAIVLQTNS